MRLSPPAAFAVDTLLNEINAPDSTCKQNDVGVKIPDFDACGLIHATHSLNPTQYSHIAGLTSHFYAHIGAGPKIFPPLMSELIWV